MNITKRKLEQIILEEIKRVEQQDLILEQLSILIDLQAKKLGVTLTEQQKDSLLRRLGQKAKKSAFGLGVGAALAGSSLGMHSMQSDYKQAIQQAVAQNVADAEARAVTPEYQASKIKQQLDNKYAFIWTTSDNPFDQTPFPAVERKNGKFEHVVFDPAKIIRQKRSVAAVLPPEWSVLKQVQDDVLSGSGPRVEAGDVVEAQGAPDKINFFNSEVWNNGKLRGALAAPPYKGAVFIDYESLPDDYAMPLTGKSPSELYVEYWDQFVTRSK